MGFVQHDENLWVRYLFNKKSTPHFIVTTTINPTSLTFVVKNLLTNQTMSSNSLDQLKELIIETEREIKLNKLLD